MGIWNQLYNVNYSLKLALRYIPPATQASLTQNPHLSRYTEIHLYIPVVQYPCSNSHSSDSPSPDEAPPPSRLATRGAARQLCRLYEPRVPAAETRHKKLAIPRHTAMMERSDRPATVGHPAASAPG